MTTVERKTRETRIRLQLEPGTGVAKVTTGIPFLDHMMVTLARYSALDIQLEASGDLKHHIIEDVAIAMGRAVAEITPANAARYGDQTIPMDDALVQACIDVGGRPFYQGPLPSALYEHWMRSFSDNAGATLHIRVIRGTDRHHIVEAAFKALGMGLRTALAEKDSVLSTKGVVSFEGR
jgi:imidazoleglycerol-phosphate dehydratase